MFLVEVKTRNIFRLCSIEAFHAVLNMKMPTNSRKKYSIALMN